LEKTPGQIRLAQKLFGNSERKFRDVGKELERAQKANAVATNHLACFEKSTGQLIREDTPELANHPSPAV